MKYIKSIVALVCCLIHFSAGMAQTMATISKREFKQLFVGSWQGTLTYLDYTSNKPYTMPADMDIKEVGKSRTFLFANAYPKEPKANAVDTVIISKDGRKLNQETIISKRKLEDGNVEIITEVPGIDGNDSKPALIRTTYVIGRKIYINRKDVQFAGQNNWIKRHEYSYIKKE